MTWNVIEKWESGDGAIGKDAEDTLNAILTGPAPVAGDGGNNGDNYLLLTLELGNVFPSISACGNVLENISRERIAPCTWLCIARYKNNIESRQTGEASFSFTTGGQTSHITNSISTRDAYVNVGTGNPLIDYNGAINWNGDTVNGVDIHTRSFDFKTTFYISPSNVSSDYVQSLYSLTGNINADTVSLNIDGVQQQFSPGELLFLGAEGSKRHGISDWEITLNWSAIPNQPSLSVGTYPSAIAGIKKRGWDYLWFTYSPGVDTTGKAKIPYITQAIVEQVYTEAALSPLLLSTTFGIAVTPPWAAPGNTDPTAVLGNVSI